MGKERDGKSETRQSVGKERDKTMRAEQVSGFRHNKDRISVALNKIENDGSIKYC